LKIDYFEMVVLCFYFYKKRYKILFDIYLVLGEQNTLNFIENFAGETINIPSIKKIKNVIRDIYIYNQIKNTKKRIGKKSCKWDKTICESLMNRFNISLHNLRMVYYKIKKIEQKFQKNYEIKKADNL